MVMVSGQEVNATRIHGNLLARIWKTLSSKPLPKIKAWRLSDEDFNAVIEQRRCYEDSLREVEEWGRVLATLIGVIELVVRLASGIVGSTRGVTHSIDCGLHVVERLAGREAQERIRKMMDYRFAVTAVRRK